MAESDSDTYKPPKFCPQCGNPVKRDGAKFCTNCGKNFLKPGSDQNLTATKGSTPVGSPPTSSSPGAAGQATPPGQSSGIGAGSATAAPTTQQTSPQMQNESAQSQPAYEREVRTSKTYDMVTPNDIRGISGGMFKRAELELIGIFSLVATASHLFRYLLLFDEFPDLWNLVVPIPVYAISIVIIFAIQKYLFRENGVEVNYEADRFDFTRSGVFSSFFLTLLPARMKIDHEKSKVPDMIYIPQSGQYGMKYEPVSRNQYIGKEVRPRMHFFSNLLIALFSLVLVIVYFRVESGSLKTMFRLVALYVSSYVVVELAPVFGRHNDQAGEYGRIRSLLIFLFGMILFLTALLGERFFVALQNIER